MSGICPDCGEESLMFSNISIFFPMTEPICMNPDCNMYAGEDV